jgi:hypothetical protein|tara:strand:- start:81 stop:506 length:426 start_codon:yes stop_codon:yes gene_type:complete
MKFSILLLILSFSALNAQCQGNLQFNQVINIQYDLADFKKNQPSADTLIVPAGKVLKITSTSLTDQFDQSSIHYNITNTARIDNLVIWGHQHRQEGGFIAHENLPIWLNSGTHIIYACSGSTTMSNNYTLSINGIEFNVIP